MCGIAGLMTRNPQGLVGRVTAMTRALAHRGPDGEGSWHCEAAGIALGHARLAIRDLSPSGAQPMVSASGRFVLTYNGELYNADEMKAALPGHVFRGTSDSEILLEHFEARGVLPTLAVANGMFALALWDRERRELLLARDRFGIKPLYWSEGEEGFFFGSELKALEADPAFPRELDNEALDAFLRLSYVPDPLSIRKAARKLEPGTLLKVRPGGVASVERWWNPQTALWEGVADQGRLGMEELVERMDALLIDAVRRQTVSDVPVGVFLSGGVDSSTVASLLSASRSQAFDSFTARFESADYDEGENAKAIARHLGLRHHEIFLTAKDALDTVPELGRVHDEPFADSSQLPTLLISRFARQSVKVVLSGDGGDEIFAGYNRHRFALADWPVIERIPLGLRRPLAAFGQALPGPVLAGLGRLAGLALPEEKMRKLLAVLPAAGLDSAYAQLVRQGLGELESPLAKVSSSPYLDASQECTNAGLSPLDRMQLKDIRHYLPGDVLAKVDRASMAVGLEARVPLLDHRLPALAFALADASRFEQGRGKALLRRVLARHLPPALFEGGPKRGFSVPIDEWLRGPLKDWAGDLLGRVKADPRFDAGRIDGWWREHLNGKRKRHHALWNLLMFQAWREAGRRA